MKAASGEGVGALASVTWGRFQHEFEKRFFPDSVKQQKVQEFASLVQGNLSVEQYAARFMKLGRFTPRLISTEKIKAQKFQGGLQSRIRRQKLVNIVVIAEAEQKSLATQINYEWKRTFMYSASGSVENKRPFAWPVKGKGIVIGRQMLPSNPECVKCSKFHCRECRFGIGVCFKCR